MSKKSGTEITFQEKFKDRMENMGRDGVLGIMKTADKPINKVEFDKLDNWNQMYNNNNTSNLCKIILTPFINSWN
jgi:hypothetical protein